MLSLFTSKIGQYAASVLVIFLAILTFGASERRKGARKSKEQGIAKDRKEADRIRSDVRDVGRGPVPDDKIEYRD